MLYNQDKMQRLARVTRGDSDFLDVFWNKDLRQVLYKLGSGSWLVKGDSNIIEDICSIMQNSKIEPHHLIADQLMVFDQKGHHGRAYENLVTDIYDCDWSDFACDDLILHFNVDVWAGLYTKEERLEIAKLTNAM